MEWRGNERTGGASAAGREARATALQGPRTHTHTMQLISSPLLWRCSPEMCLSLSSSIVPGSGGVQKLAIEPAARGVAAADATLEARVRWLQPAASTRSPPRRRRCSLPPPVLHLPPLGVPLPLASSAWRQRRGRPLAAWREWSGRRPCVPVCGVSFASVSAGGASLLCRSCRVVAVTVPARHSWFGWRRWTQCSAMEAPLLSV